jgi:cobalt-zinc-cadmium efflux system outer membrane protein
MKREAPRFLALGVVLAAVSVAVTPSHAQETSSHIHLAPPLTLAEAVAGVRARHPELAALRAQFDADRLKSEAERGLMPPMLEAEVREWPIDTLNPGDAMLGVMLVQEFPGRGKREARAALAEREADVTWASVAVRERDLILQTRKAYTELQLARHTAGVYRQTADLLRQVTEVAEARYAAGRLGQQDVLKAIVERTLLEEQVLVVEERARVSIAMLNALLGQPPDAAIGTTDPLVDDLELPAAGDLHRLALASQPALAAVDADIARREAALLQASRERGVDYVARGGFMVRPDERNAWTAQFGLTWPGAPWARGRFDASEKAQAAQIDAARADRKAAENAAGLAVQEAWVRADAANRRARLLRSSVVPQAEHALEVARLSYQANRATFLDVLDLERVLLEARLGVVRALADRDLALADLERAVGRDLQTEPRR